MLLGMPLLLILLLVLAGAPVPFSAGLSALSHPLSFARPVLVAWPGLFARPVLVAWPGSFAPPVSFAGSVSFVWPVAEPRVVRPFDPPAEPWLAGHRGVDLAADPGTPVRSAGAGVVVHAGPVAGRGVVSVAHAGGLRTTYEPVSPAVAPGDRVAPGDAIGHVDAGHPGCPAPACLHWGARRDGAYLDPAALLGRGPVRLLPLQPV